MSAMNSTLKHCSSCGRRVPADAPAELCPSCLMKGGFSQDASLVETQSDSGSTLHLVIPEDAPGPDGAPKQLGSYEVLEKIAQGGMGIVYKARHIGLDRVVALKMIRSGILATPRDVERFQREARSAAKLHHPNIVTIHDIGEQDGQHYYTMDYVPGDNLSERARTKPFSPRQAAEITAGVAAAIHYAHQHGVLHRDIKPANVILTPEQQPRVLDFGLALVLTDDSDLTQSGTPIGSPSYMPPEQAAGRTRHTDARSDVYSLGALLYELLTGRPPFQAATTVETLKLVVENEAVSPRRLNPALPRDLETICLKCLEKGPDRRYQTAQELGDELGRFTRDEPILARPVPQAEKVWRWCRRKPLVASLSATTLALLVSVAIGTPIALYRISQQRTRAELSNEETRRRAYAAEITVAFQALAENNLGRAIKLLDRQRPKPGEEDLRGFEWRHLWQLCQPDEKVTFRDQGAQAVAFSADGRWLAYGAEQIVIRALPSKAVVTIISNAATTLAFSPTGKLLASGHDTHVKLWSTESWQELHSPPDARPPAVFSPDGKWLITGTAGGYQDRQWATNFLNGGYLVWNAETWDRAGYCAGGPTFAEQSFQAVAFSPDGKLLVTAGHPGGREVGQFQVWDFPALTVRTNFEFFPFKLGSAVFTPDGKQLLTGSWYGELLVWDVAEGRVVDSLNSHTGWIAAITYARDGRTFATASADRTLIIWDAATREVLVRLRGHLEEIRPVAMSPDGRMLASGSFDGTTKLWDATTRHERRKLAGLALIAGFSADSRLAVVHGQKGFRLWQLADGALTPIPLDKFTFRGIQSWADARGLEPHAVFGQTNGTLEYWNLATMSRMATWRASETEVSTAALSPDGRFIATGDADGVLRFWDAATHREVRRFDTFGGKLACLTFSPDGRLVAGSESSKPRFGIWDVESGRLLHRIDSRGAGVPSVAGAPRVISLAFSPDGKSLATAETDAARLWDVRSGKLRTALKAHTQAVMGVAYSPDGKTLATAADDRKVKLWNLATEQEVATLEPLTGGCRSIRFSPDGRILAVGHYLDPVPYLWLWQVPSFDEIAAVEEKEKAE